MKICVHHIIGGCPNCISDEGNQNCPYYVPASPLILVVVSEGPSGSQQEEKDDTRHDPQPNAQFAPRLPEGS